MRPIARVYIAAVLLLGTASMVCASWRFVRPWEMLGVFCAALLASGMKVRLPGIFGTMSVNYLFILLGITDMGSGEAIAIGCGSALMQCAWHAKKDVRPVHAAFSTMNVAIAAAVSYAFYHMPLVQKLNHETPLALMASSLLYFGMNTGGVAAVIGLTEGKSLISTWRECYFWSFPFICWRLRSSGLSEASMLVPSGLAF